MALPSKLDRQDIDGEGYKRFFGGKAEEWTVRGKFQLHLLQKLGLRPCDRFLDFGCGPLCGGVHIIQFLQERKYVGLDTHPDLVDIANREIIKLGLDIHKPVVSTIAEYSCQEVFDKALAFSVPFWRDKRGNNTEDKFFSLIRSMMKENGKFFITHAKNFRDTPKNWSIEKLLEKQEDFNPSLCLDDWSKTAKDIFPLIILRAI